MTHGVPIAARLAGQRQIDLRLLPGRVRRTTQAAVGADTVAALSQLRVDVALPRYQRRHRGARAHHARSRRGRGQARVDRERPPGRGPRGRVEVRRRDGRPLRGRRRDRRPRHRLRRLVRRPQGADQGRRRGGRRMTPRSAAPTRGAHDRHPHRQPQPRPHGQPHRPPRAGHGPARRLGHLPGRRQGREHLPRVRGRRPALDRRAPGRQGRPVRARAARCRHRLPPGRARGRPSREHHHHRARRHHHEAQQPRPPGDAPTAPAPGGGTGTPRRDCRLDRARRAPFRPARRRSGTPSWSPRCVTPGPASPSTPATLPSRPWSTLCPRARRI